MRIGFVGPAEDDVALLKEGIEFLIGDAEVDQVIYLADDDAIDRAVTEWAEEIMEGSASLDAFLDRVMAVAQFGDSDAIERLITADRAVQRLRCVRKLPASPARAIEMIAKRIVTVVYDKATLTEDDIANATLLVYGRSDELLLKRFGTRYFFTPGPLKKRKVGIFEVSEEGEISVEAFEPSGEPLFRETLQSGKKGKMTVAQ